MPKPGEIKKFPHAGILNKEQFIYTPEGTFWSGMQFCPNEVRTLSVIPCGFWLQRSPKSLNWDNIIDCLSVYTGKLRLPTPDELTYASRGQDGDKYGQGGTNRILTLNHDNNSLNLRDNAVPIFTVSSNGMQTRWYRYGFLVQDLMGTRISRIPVSNTTINYPIGFFIELQMEAVKPLLERKMIWTRFIWSGN